MTSVLKRDREKPGEDRGRDWRGAATSQGVHGAGRSWKGQTGHSPRVPGWQRGLTTPGFWTSGLQDLQRETSIVSSSQVCGH